MEKYQEVSCSLRNKQLVKIFNVINLEDIDKYEGIEDIDQHFLVKGDKLLVKAPYYKYNYRIYSSSD